MRPCCRAVWSRPAERFRCPWGATAGPTACFLGHRRGAEPAAGKTVLEQRPAATAGRRAELTARPTAAPAARTKLAQERAALQSAPGSAAAELAGANAKFSGNRPAREAQPVRLRAATSGSREKTSRAGRMPRNVPRASSRRPPRNAPLTSATCWRPVGKMRGCGICCRRRSATEFRVFPNSAMKGGDYRAAPASAGHTRSDRLGRPADQRPRGPDECPAGGGDADVGQASGPIAA